MIHPFLEFGGILFYVLLGVITLILASLVDEEKVGKASTGFILMIAAIVAFTNAPILDIVKNHPIYILYGIGGYIGLGVIWSVVKWRLFFLPALFEEYTKLRSEWLERRKLKEMPADPSIVAEFNDRSDVRNLNVNYYRMVRHNKGRITTWMIFWPFSFVGTFIGQFLHRVFSSIYNAIAGGLQKMSDRMASKYSELG